MVDRSPERRSSTVTIGIDSIAAGGDGVGRIDGMAVFIPRTAPGDVVSASIVVHKKRFGRGRLRTIQKRSEARVDPLCQHYDGDDCGGCQLQHLSASAQLDAKARIVRDTLLRIGRRHIDVPQITRSPEQWDYRQKLTLSLAKDPTNNEWVGGLHPLGQPDAVFSLEECRISSPALVSAWHAVRHASKHLPHADALRITFRLVPGTSDVALIVAGGTAWNHWTLFADTIKSLAALWWIPDDAPRVELRTPGKSAESTAAGFVQINASLSGTMHEHVLGKVNAFSPTRVVDAYAGTGTLALALAESGVRVTAIEWDESAVALMQRSLPADSIAMASSVESVIDEVLSSTDAFDVVVVNPPRVGLEPRVTSALDAQGAETLRAIIYVSCDPGTLARDLARLPAWRIQDIHCFDMFPQTAHVETVCVLVPERS